MNTLHVPENVGVAIKALGMGTARPEQQTLAYSWITKELCATGGSEALLGALPYGADTMGWYAGRRFVGQALKDIVAEPLPAPAPVMKPEPRTRARRGRT